METVGEAISGCRVIQEEFTQNCCHCGVPIKLKWNNGLIPGDFVLVADWVFHPECWDEMVKENPPEEPC